MELLTSPISFNVDIYDIELETDLQSPTIPYGFEKLSNLIGTNAEINSQILEFSTNKKCKLIEYVVLNYEGTRKSAIVIICRELESGYYLGVSIQPSTNENECLASYVYLFSQQKQIGELEKTWCKLTQKASADDWDNLDWIITELINGSSNSEIFFVEHEYYANNRAIFPNLVQSIMNTCDMSADKESGLTALVIANEEEQRCLGVILNDADGFAKRTVVYDDFEDIELCFDSLYLGFEAYTQETLIMYCDADSEDEDEDN